DIGGIEQRDAEFDGAVDDAFRSVDLHRTEIVAAEADHRDRDSRLAQCALFHGRRSLKGGCNEVIASASARERGPDRRDTGDSRLMPRRCGTCRTKKKRAPLTRRPDSLPSDAGYQLAPSEMPITRGSSEKTFVNSAEVGSVR